MSRADETRAIRIEKVKKLQEQGILAYPGSVKRSHPIADLKKDFEDLQKSEKEVTITGRIRSIRRHGGSCFADVQDESGTFQIFLSKQQLDEAFTRFVELFDPSDFVQVSGTLFLTKQDQQSLQVHSVVMLAKALRDIPTEHYGIKDLDTRLRKRYLDLAVNAETRELFRKKALFWQTIRDFLLQRGFLEVYLPVLEHVPGGAETEPFITHYNALDEDFYLRISLELPLKKLLVGGYEKVFEIGRIFRNEGVSPEHLQDYTQLEFYWAYADYRQLMDMLKELYREIALAVLGTTIATRNGVSVDWGAEWKTYDYVSMFEEYTKLSLHKTSDDELRAFAKAHDIDVEPSAGRGRIIDVIYKKTVRPNLIQPGFLINPPVEIEPLAKRLVDDPSRVERLQVVAWGTELGKGFTELNDPLDQRERFEAQMKLREHGDTEAQQIDEDYLEAQEYGMPPNTGFGLSERLFAVFMDKSVREIVMFPPMKREEEK